MKRGLRRAVGAALVGSVVGVTSVAGVQDAAATGALSAGDDHVPLEQRVALAIGPTRTTLWTQLRADTMTGGLAIIVPAAPGASVDWTNDAWFEALEAATAPRVLPPSGVVPACPGDDPPDDPVDVVGELFHVAPLTPLEVLVLDDADAVAGWAAANGLVVSPGAYDALAMLGGKFVAARFNALAGEALTPALRISGPGVAPVLPLVLTEAIDDLLVTSFVLAEGTATLDGPETTIDASFLSYDAASSTSNYPLVRSVALDADAWLLEATGRAALTDDVTIADGAHMIDSAIGSYFTRAALYDALSFDAPTCIAMVQQALASNAAVAPSCARADLFVVDGIDTCTETVQGGEVDPALLRCGNDADDLAVAMSEHVASDTWLSRHAMEIPAASRGAVRTVGVTPASAQQPTFVADELDLSNCDGGGGAGGMGAGGTGGSAGMGGTTTEVVIDVPVYEVHSGCGADEVGAVLYTIEVILADVDDEAPDAYYVEEADDCGGDTSDSVAPVYERRRRIGWAPGRHRRGRARWRLPGRRLRWLRRERRRLRRRHLRELRDLRERRDVRLRIGERLQRQRVRRGHERLERRGLELCRVAAEETPAAAADERAVDGVARHRVSAPALHAAPRDALSRTTA